LGADKLTGWHGNHREKKGRLSGKTAIITGGAGGQGAREAELFAAEGANVVITDVLLSSAQEVADRVIKAGGQAIAVSHDVSSEDDWINVVRLAAESFGSIHILVNNAAISKSSPAVANLPPDQAWDRILAVNLTGIFLGIKHTVPYLRQAGGGSIINISSVGGLTTLGGDPTAYALAKGAIRSLSKGAANEYAADRIRVNSVYPGFVETPLIHTQIVEMKDELLASIPLNRLGTVDDVAYGVLYLASDESSYVTGTELIIDGGVL